MRAGVKTLPPIISALRVSPDNHINLRTYVRLVVDHGLRYVFKRRAQGYDDTTKESALISSGSQANNLRKTT